MSSDHDIIHMFREWNLMLCVLLNCELFVLTSWYLISSMPKMASIASSMFSWTAALAQGKTLFQGGFKFCWKKKLIRPCNTIYTIAPSACDAQGMQNSSANLCQPTTGTQHLSLLEIRISSLLPIILVVQGLLNKWPPEEKLKINPQAPAYPQNNPPSIIELLLSWKEGEEWLHRVSFTRLLLRLVSVIIWALCTAHPAQSS